MTTGLNPGLGLDFSLGSLLAGVLIILVKLLSILLVVGLVLGVWVIVKDYMVSDGENPFASLTKGFGGVKNRKFQTWVVVEFGIFLSY